MTLVEKIAFEKAGIIKSDVPVIFGGEGKAVKVIENVAKDKGSRFTLVNKNALCNISSTLDGTYFDFGERKDLKLSLLGLYQPENAANVITAVDELKALGFEINERAIYEGLKKATWSARFEIIKREPLVIFDGAHNPEGVEVAVRSIKHYFGDKKVVVLTGVMKDKDYNYIADKLSEIAESVFTITPDNPRALDAACYADVFASRRILATPNCCVEEALEKAEARAKVKNTALVCLGSLYMYKEISEKI